MVEEAGKTMEGIEKELRDYAEEGYKKGYTKEEIREILVGQGFRAEIVDKALGSRGLVKTKKMFIWIIVIVLIVGVIGTGGYFGWKYRDQIGGVFGSNLETTNANSQVIDNSAILDNGNSIAGEAVAKGDYSVCDRGATGKDKLGCKIGVAVSLGDREFCRGDLDDSIKFGFAVNSNGPEDTVYIGAKDYCWISITDSTKVNYCDNLSSEGNKNICREALNENITA